MNQTVDELTDKEVAWLATQLKVASSFVNCYSPGDSGRPLSLAAIDRAYATWISTPDETDVINGIINGTGVALGQFLVDHAGFRWVIATDDQESALAVLALPGAGDVLVYPINFVAKRWERGRSISSTSPTNKSLRRSALSRHGLGRGRSRGGGFGSGRRGRRSQLARRVFSSARDMRSRKFAGLGAGSRLVFGDPQGDQFRLRPAALSIPV